MIDDYIIDIFMKHLLESMLVKLWAMLELQEVAIMGGWSEEQISPLESLEYCSKGGC